MAKDLCGNLKDDWWANAKSASKWKQKFECVQEVFEILTGAQKLDVEITADIAKFPEKKANDFFKLVTDWIVNENHIFTRIGLFRLLPKLIAKHMSYSNI